MSLILFNQKLPRAAPPTYSGGSGETRGYKRKIQTHERQRLFVTLPLVVPKAPEGLYLLAGAACKAVCTAFKPLSLSTNGMQRGDAP